MENIKNFYQFLNEEWNPFKKNTKEEEISIDDREKDIQTICKYIISRNVEDIGDSGMGGRCPFCYIGCSWADDLNKIEHEPGCIYLIAKDLMTGFKK